MWSQKLEQVFALHVAAWVCTHGRLQTEEFFHRQKLALIASWIVISMFFCFSLSFSIKTRAKLMSFALYLVGTTKLIFLSFPFPNYLSAFKFFFLSLSVVGKSHSPRSPGSFVLFDKVTARCAAPSEG